MVRLGWWRCLVAGATVAATAGCVPVGERPSLGEAVEAPASDPPPTGVAEVDALLERLAAVDGETFTARYSVTRKLGPVTTEAVVAQAPPQRTVQVGTVVFVTGEAEEDRTCSVDTGDCEPGVVEQRISQVGISAGFFAPAPANALRVAAGRRVGEVATSTRDLAGISADCVQVPLGPGAEVYCVSPQGPIAYMDTAALTVELLQMSADATPEALVPAPPAG